MIINEHTVDILNSSNLSGYVVNETYKEKIVELKWERWDLNSNEPDLYPVGDMDAKEYITRRKYNEILSKKIGNLYTLTFEKQSYIYKDESDQYFLSCNKTISLDFFVADEMRNKEIYVSNREKSFFGKTFCRISDICRDRYWNTY